MISAYPLCWPKDQPRNKNPKRHAAYKTAFWDAYGETVAALRLFKAHGIVISTNVPLRRDGLPYADGDSGVHDAGVAVYFTRAGQQYVFACDVYDRLRWNMRAVGLAIEGLRAVERSGATHFLDRALSGFAQLPSGTSSTQRPWREVLNLEGFSGPGFAVRAGVEAAFKALSRSRHPDAGGSDSAMVELNLAREAALKEIGGT